MLNPLQEKLLDMLKWFHNYCVENDIKYYIIAGTMLGAARHNGFIPWDDDVDVAIPRKDYMKVIEDLKVQRDKYIVESPLSDAPDYKYSFAKLYDTTTTLTEHARKDCTRGVYLDIFPLDGTGNTYEESVKNFRKFALRNNFLMVRTCALRKDRSFFKNACIVIGRLIPGFLVNEKKLARKVDAISARTDFDSSEYVMVYPSTYCERDIIKKSAYGKPTLYKFEDAEVYGPENAEEYLTHVYHDWRKLPPEDKRHSAHDFEDIDLEHSYLKK